jgi:integrase
MMMADALSDHRLIRSPCDGIKAPKRTHKRREYLDHEQAEQLAEAVGQDGFMVRLKAYTGLRWGELAGLTVGAVDLKRRRLQINGSCVEADGKVVWKAPKVDHERRSVPFPVFLKDDLKVVMAGKGRDDLVFTAPQEGVLRVSHWRPRVFNPARDSLGSEFPRITPHDLRHTADSLVFRLLAMPSRSRGCWGISLRRRRSKHNADLFDSALDALAHVLDEARTAALKASSVAVDDSGLSGENVPGTLVEIA